ncbi:MAG: 6-pyruvoyl trahydropterin synthase family protein, partial [Candidatus Marinamargulisbacteria bacterium]
IQRRETFCASHRLCNPELSELENQERYKKCATIHGHNYVLLVSISGPVDRETGMIIAFEDMKQCIGGVVDAFDHTYLNDHDFFKDQPTTVENLAQLIWQLLESAFCGRVQLDRIELFETEKNSVVLMRD